jgi:hypothetical protein
MTPQPLDTTLQFALSDAARALLAAAQLAYQRGELRQVELLPGSGVWQLLGGRS